MRGLHLVQLTFCFVWLVQLHFKSVAGLIEPPAMDKGIPPKMDSSIPPKTTGIPITYKNTQNVPERKYQPPYIPLRPCFHSLSYFPNSPWKPGVVFRGGPCGPIRSMGCEGFGCGSGIGFPVRTLNCCCKDSKIKPVKGSVSTKRFDITSLPARPPAAAVSDKQPETKPTKDPANQNQSHVKPKKVIKVSSKDAPKIDLQLKLSDDLTIPDEVASHQSHRHRHHRRRRPWYSSSDHDAPTAHVRPRPKLTSNYLPIEVRLPHPNYWRFQGYNPHYMRIRASWAMNPSDMKNLHNYPEYQYFDVPFVQTKHQHKKKPPFIDYNDLSVEEDELQRAIDESTHMKNKIKSHHEYKHDEEDRKMVDNSEDKIETKKQTKDKPSFPVQESDGPFAKQGADGFNLHLKEKEDEQKNYPEYASQFNTDHYWSNSMKQKVPVRRFEFRRPVAEKGSSIFKEFKPENPGFDLDNIAKFHQKGRAKHMQNVEPKKTHSIPSVEGIMVKSDPQSIANEIKSFV